MLIMIENETISLSLLDLPKEVRVTYIHPNFSLKEHSLFAQTSQQAFNEVKETAFERLLRSAVDAEPQSYQQVDKKKLAAIFILKKHPELLFKEGIVTDHFGRKIKASPYRLFLGAGDVWASKQVHDEILPKIKDGVILAQTQFQAQFPNCPWQYHPRMNEEVLYDDRNKRQIAEVIAQLKIIKNKIEDDPCTHGQATLDVTTAAVTDLCQIFAPKENEIIKTGLHFPLRIMQEIYRVNKDCSWSSAQLIFYSRTVIGAALRASTAVDGQIYKRGFYYVECGTSPNRTDGLFCPHPRGVPLKLAPIRDKLGRTMFVDIFHGYSCVYSSDPFDVNWFNKFGPCLNGVSVLWDEPLNLYVKQKLNIMRDYIEPCLDESTKRFKNSIRV